MSVEHTPEQQLEINEYEQQKLNWIDKLEDDPIVMRDFLSNVWAELDPITLYWYQRYVNRQDYIEASKIFETHWRKFLRESAETKLIG